MIEIEFLKIRNTFSVTNDYALIFRGDFVLVLRHM